MAEENKGLLQLLNPLEGWKEGFWDPLRGVGSKLYDLDDAVLGALQGAGRKLFDLDARVFGEEEARKAAEGLTSPFTGGLEYGATTFPAGRGVAQARGYGVAEKAPSEMTTQEIEIKLSQPGSRAKVEPYIREYLGRQDKSEGIDLDALRKLAEQERAMWKGFPPKPTKKIPDKTRARKVSPGETVGTPVRNLPPSFLGAGYLPKGAGLFAPTEAAQLGALPFKPSDIRFAQAPAAEQKPNFWIDLLKKMFIPGQTPTGIPWIFPTIWAMAGTPETARPMAMWLQLRSQVAGKEQQRKEAKRLAYNQIAGQWESGNVELTEEQRKQYADVNPGLLKKRAYTKFQRYYWNGKSWIPEEKAIEQGLDVSSMPMSGQQEAYIDWDVRFKTPEERTLETEAANRKIRERQVSQMFAKARERGMDTKDPAFLTTIHRYRMFGVMPDAQWVQTDGRKVFIDPLFGVVDSIETGMTDKERIIFQRQQQELLAEHVRRYEQAHPDMSTENIMRNMVMLEKHVTSYYKMQIDDINRVLDEVSEARTDPFGKKTLLDMGFDLDKPGEEKRLADEMANLKTKRDGLRSDMWNALATLNEEVRKRGSSANWWKVMKEARERREKEERKTGLARTDQERKAKLYNAVTGAE